MSTPRRPTAGRRPARPGARPRTTSRTTSRSTDAAAVAGRPAKRPAGTPRRSPLTPRAAVLALVVCGLLVSAALPLREYLDQRGRIAELEQAQAEARARVAALEAEKERLHDPAYVAAQARRRLHFVLPGETAYVLLPPEESAAEQLEGVGPAGPDAPWYSQVWGSVSAADRPEPSPAP
jgi:cell division protein FtsB